MATQIRAWRVEIWLDYQMKWRKFLHYSLGSHEKAYLWESVFGTKREALRQGAALLRELDQEASELARQGGPIAYWEFWSENWPSISEQLRSLQEQACETEMFGAQLLTEMSSKD